MADAWESENYGEDEWESENCQQYEPESSYDIDYEAIHKHGMFCPPEPDHDEACSAPDYEEMFYTSEMLSESSGREYENYEEYGNEYEELSEYEPDTVHQDQFKRLEKQWLLIKFEGLNKPHELEKMALQLLQLEATLPNAERTKYGYKATRWLLEYSFREGNTDATKKHYQSLVTNYSAYWLDGDGKKRLVAPEILKVCT